jgi:hypothetical protein
MIACVCQFAEVTGVGRFTVIPERPAPMPLTHRWSGGPSRFACNRIWRWEERATRLRHATFLQKYGLVRCLLTGIDSLWRNDELTGRT